MPNLQRNHTKSTKCTFKAGTAVEDKKYYDVHVSNEMAGMIFESKSWVTKHGRCVILGWNNQQWRASWEQP
jgi:hypothetical protein